MRKRRRQPMIGINHVLPAHSMMTFFLFFFEVQNE